MEICFLGVAGGRIATAKQIKGYSTGGFRIKTNGIEIAVDPGPTAAYKTSLCRYRIERTNILVVSHNHLDHVNDANVFAEAMNGYGFKKKGILIASRNALKGKDRILTDYHINMFKEVYEGKPGNELSVLGIKFIFTPIKHSEETGFGFIMESEGKRIGYTSDTVLFEELPDYFKNTDVLIANIGKTKPGKYNVHMSLFPEGVELFKKAQPKLGIVYHLGFEFILYKNKEELIKKAEKESGTKLILPRDMFKLRL